ncbi:MAG: outer membrane beta-barrel protein [Deltaproteobacteria bacterium]|nr:outer membrane beta-barrel protein [Deltaproteobacteria bacterium]
MIARLATVMLLGGTLAAHAQAPAPPELPAESAQPNAPLAQIRGEKDLAAALTAITSDPAVPVDDPGVRPLAQALMTEGVRQLLAHAYDQALANFLEAYGKFPSPRILLNIASTLRDMGRPADAANTYQRYLMDPGSGSERAAEVKEILQKLDEQLTVLTVRVVPRGSDISIDGGPFIAVGSSLQTRVRPGIHLVRIRKVDHVRKSEDASEMTVNGFDGEVKEVAIVLQLALPDPPTPPAPDPQQVRPPEQVHAWLNDSTRYGTGESKGTNGEPTRTVLLTNNAVLRPIIPAFDIGDDGNAVVHYDTGLKINSGVVGVVRIDGKGRGFAGGLGIAIASDRFEGEAMVLRSDITGGYLGGRIRLFKGWLRPYVAGGFPAFIYDKADVSGQKTKHLAFGVRAAAGVELVVNGHLSVQGDLGYEHFFGIEGTAFDADVFVPTIGVIGRL